MNKYERAQTIRQRIDRLYDLKWLFENYKLGEHTIKLTNSYSEIVNFVDNLDEVMQVKLIKAVDEEIELMEQEFKNL